MFYFQDDYSVQCLSPRLRATLHRIHDSLITCSDDGGGDRVQPPHISPMVNLSESEQLYGLAERVVATESLAFLAQQFDFLQPHLEALIPAGKKAFLQQFYSQVKVFYSL